MEQVERSGNSNHKAVLDSTNQAFAAFLGNYYELVVARDMAPILLQIIADIASGFLLPQLIAEIVKMLSGNAKGIDKNKLKVILDQLEKKKVVVRQNVRESITKTTANNPHVLFHKQAITRVTLTTAVFHLETYLTDTFKAILGHNPATISLFDPKKKAAEAYNKGDYESLEEAVVRIHHREINFQDIEKTKAAYDKVEIHLFAESNLQDRLKILFAKRRLIVHRGGRINQEYLKNSGGNGEKLGDHLILPEQYVETAMNDIFLIVIQMEEQIVRKHLLPRDREKALDSVGDEIVKKLFGSSLSRLRST